MGGREEDIFFPKKFHPKAGCQPQPHFYFLCINGILILLFSLHFTDLGRAYEDTVCRLLVVICQQSSGPVVEAETVGVGGESGMRAGKVPLGSSEGHPSSRCPGCFQRRGP